MSFFSALLKVQPDIPEEDKVENIFWGMKLVVILGVVALTLRELFRVKFHL